MLQAAWGGIDVVIRLLLGGRQIIQTILANQPPRCMSLLWVQRNSLPTNWLKQREAMAGLDT